MAIAPPEAVGSYGLAAAPGYGAALFRWRGGLQEVELRPEAGIRLQVVWADTRAPVLNATVRRHFAWDEADPRRHTGLDGAWLEAAWHQCAPGEVVTDVEGRAFLAAADPPAQLRLLLEVGAAGAAAQWFDLVQYGARDPVRDAWLPAVLALERGTGFTVQLRDAAGAPLAETPVELQATGRRFAVRSDAAGVARFPVRVAQTWPEDAIEVDLGRERRWRGRWSQASDGAAAQLTADYRAFLVHVIAAEPQRYEVASVHLYAGPDAWGSARPAALERLYWVPVPADGVAVLETGWQGEVTGAFLRERGRGTVAARATLAPDRPTLLEPAPLCRLHLTLAAGRAPTSESATFARGGAAAGEEPLVVVLRDLPLVLELPQAVYEVEVSGLRGGARAERLDLRRPEAAWEIQLLEPALLRGTVRGHFSGPVSGARLELRDAGGDTFQEAYTGPGGRFEVEWYAAGPGTLEVWRPSARGQWWLSKDPAARLPLPAAPGAQPWDIVLEEGRLRVQIDPADALLARPGLSYFLTRWNADGSFPLRRTYIEELAANPAAAVELIVPPAEYSVEWGHQVRAKAGSARVYVAAGATQDLWLRNTEFGCLEVWARGPAGVQYVPSWRCTDGAGVERWNEGEFVYQFSTAEEEPMRYYLAPGDLVFTAGGDLLLADGTRRALPPAAFSFTLRAGGLVALRLELTGQEILRLDFYP